MYTTHVTELTDNIKPVQIMCTTHITELTDNIALLTHVSNRMLFPPSKPYHINNTNSPEEEKHGKPRMNTTK